MLARAFHCWWSWLNIFSFFRRPVLRGPHGENSGDFRGKTESSPIGSLAQVSPRHRSRRAQEPTQASVRRGSGIAQVSLAWLYSMHHIGYKSVVWNDTLVSTIRRFFQRGDWGFRDLPSVFHPSRLLPDWQASRAGRTACKCRAAVNKYILFVYF